MSEPRLTICKRARVHSLFGMGGPYWLAFAAPANAAGWHTPRPRAINWSAPKVRPTPMPGGVMGMTGDLHDCDTSTWLAAISRWAAPNRLASASSFLSSSSRFFALRYIMKVAAANAATAAGITHGAKKD